MSEQNDPVAEIPDASNLVTDGEATPADPATTKAPLSKRQWPWFVVVGVSAITALSGYALGHTNGEGNHHQPPVGLNGPVQGGVNPDGDNRNGGGKRGHHGQQMPGQPGMQGQDGMPGQQMLPGQPMQGQPGFGPHCEDSTGLHAPMNADGTCPTGFVLDDKGQPPVQVAPTPSASASIS